jgi:glycosyltransferase involved in cell wall biosynthesis
LGKKSPFCGNVTYGLTITEALRARGHAISFIHFDTPAGRPQRATLSELAGLDPRANARSDDGPGEPPDVALPYLVKSQVYTIPSPGAQKELRESLERLRPDLVHASLTLSPLDFLLPDLCQQLGVPLVATFHPAFDAGLRHLTAGTQHLTYQLYAPSLARFDRVIVFSGVQAGLLARLGVPEGRLAVIPNGVDLDRWQPADGEALQGLGQGRTAALRRRLGPGRIFLYMGRVSTEKNLEALLRAWRLVRPDGCRLVIVGDGPLRTPLQQSHDHPDVTWWGYEPDPEIRISLMQLAEVFVLPSLVEGLSLALLEAMACGTACVATDAGADGEVLADGAGIVLRTQGVTTQLRTLLPVLRDQPVLTAELGRRARRRVVERYDLSTNLDRLERLYGDLISGPADPDSSARRPLQGLRPG